MYTFGPLRKPHTDTGDQQPMGRSMMKQLGQRAPPCRELIAGRAGLSVNMQLQGRAAVGAGGAALRRTCRPQLSPSHRLGSWLGWCHAAGQPPAASRLQYGRLSGGESRAAAAVE